jgi:hypothetical protein
MICPGNDSTKPGHFNVSVSAFSGDFLKGRIFREDKTTTRAGGAGLF